MSYRIISLCLLLGACAGPQVVEKPVPVIVEKEIQIPLSPELFLACENAYESKNEIISNGDLLLLLHSQQLLISCLNSRLEAIRNLNPPSP